MSKTFAPLCVAMLVTGLAGQAKAQPAEPRDRFTIDAGYSYFDIEVDEFGIAAEAGAFTARVGYKPNRYFAIELEGGASVKDVLIDLSGAQLSVGLDYFAAVLAKGLYPVSERTELYGYAGYLYGLANAEAIADGTSFIEVSLSETMPLWGAGVRYTFNDPMYGQFEYSRLDANLDGVPISFGANILTLAVGRSF